MNSLPKILISSRRRRAVIPTILGLILPVLAATAASLEEAQDRIVARQPEIEQLLKDKKAGERNDGLLEPQEGLIGNQQNLIDEENRDRSQLFSEIANMTGTTPDEVGSKRAEMIRDRLIPGILRMIPDGQGGWKWDDDLEPEIEELPRLLTRPGANLHDAPEGAIKISGVTQYTMYEVIGQTAGAEGAWYHVAESGASAGWIPESQALEWRQALVMDFTSQRDRNRLLFFDDKEQIRTLAATPNPQRGNEASMMAAQAASGQSPGRGVIAIEPVFDPLTQDTPVIIPIIEHEPFTIDGARETNLLRVAAATRKDPGASNQGPAPAREPDIDIVFVLDTTSSMGPYLKETQAAVKNFARNTAGTNSSIRFGVVGYRDSDPRFREKMGYTVQNFTPTLLDAASFAAVLDGVTALPSDPGDPVPEDVFSGVHAAIGSAWRNAPGEGIRIIMLVGDASGNDPFTSSGSRNLSNQSGLNRTSVRQMLNDARIVLQALHIRAPKYRADHGKAQADFSELSRNPDSAGGIVRMVAIDFDPQVYARSIQQPFAQMESFLTMDKQQFVQQTQAQNQRITQGTAAPTAGQSFAGILANAYADWVAGQNTASLDLDFKGWVIPNDLKEPARQAMDVRLLLRRVELENLKRRLDNVLEAGRAQTTSGGDFFDLIQRSSGLAIKDPSSSTFEEVFDVPEYVKNLPYKSRILGMRRGQWEAMSESEKTTYLNDWQGMSEYFGKRLLEPVTAGNNGTWRRLSENGDPFVMIPLDQLP